MNAEQKTARDKKLHTFQEQLGYIFHDRGLLERALCHSSYSNENGIAESNERLEFLGDAVLELTVSHLLFDFYSKDDEGHLTRERAKLVCKNSLVKIAKSLKFENLVLCGNSMKQSNVPESICADAFEAVLGALYLDGGYDDALRTVKRLLAFQAEAVSAKNVTKRAPNDDPKSRLQTIAQKRKIKIPEYSTVSIDGPSHAPNFKTKVVFDGKSYLGEGNSKKNAEFCAAEKALEKLSDDGSDKNEEAISLLSKMKKIFLPFALIFIFVSSAHAADVKIMTTSALVAALAHYIGGGYVDAVPFIDPNGDRLRGREFAVAKESNIIAIDVEESNKFGLGDYPNLFLLYENAPFKLNEKEYYFGDPSVIPFLAQKIFVAVSRIDPENFTVYQRQLSVFQTKFNSAVLAGRALLRGLKVLDLTGGSGYFLTAAGCEVSMPKREDFRKWARGQELPMLAEAIKNIQEAGGVVVFDESTPRNIRAAAGANVVSVSFSRPPAAQDVVEFFHSQYLALWNQVKNKVPQ